MDFSWKTCLYSNIKTSWMGRSETHDPFYVLARSREISLSSLRLMPYSEILLKYVHKYRPVLSLPYETSLRTIIWMLKRLTLNVQGPSYLGLNRSISWLLMPWLLTSPGHQQPWYWLYSICRSFSYLRNDFKYLCHINVEKWHKM